MINCERTRIRKTPKIIRNKRIKTNPVYIDHPVSRKTKKRRRAQPKSRSRKKETTQKAREEIRKETRRNRTENRDESQKAEQRRAQKLFHQNNKKKTRLKPRCS
ncbi:hypothetical protein BJ508DRAFT_42197 [Ascobolus immersus RN42]|uniref:Uncharacterized protein n=1 Tax=Ascobolus immersus RN42 TaxID=1160509 RepID=A0A3N4IRG8_ASCIM|nr:hypothetical protein BJ508DRAFT_42197 [Ascobolus immersus RN42]